MVQLKISLDYLQPEIWRRLLVPGDCTMSRLHDVFQAAMGSQDCHLHSFTIQDRRYGVPNPDWYDDALDARLHLMDQCSQNDAPPAFSAVLTN